jgi:hypothetical protein
LRLHAAAAHIRVISRDPVMVLLCALPLPVPTSRQLFLSNTIRFILLLFRSSNVCTLNTGFIMSIVQCLCTMDSVFVHRAIIGGVSCYWSPDGCRHFVLHMGQSSGEIMSTESSVLREFSPYFIALINGEATTH